jgi:hypothetical protein
MTKAPAETYSARVVERRRWHRIPGHCLEVTLWTDAGKPQKATVLDVSLNGIGVLIDNTPTLATEQTVRVDYDGRPMCAIVRNLRPGRGGIHRVGLEWSGDELRPLSLAGLGFGHF